MKQSLKGIISKSIGPNGKANGTVFWPPKSFPLDEYNIQKVLSEVGEFLRGNSRGIITVHVDELLENK
jgi:hypothetical protein